MSVRPAAAVRADSWRAARTLVTAGRSFDVDVQDRDTGLALEPVPTAYYDRAYEALQAFGAGSGGGKRYVDERGASARRSYLMEKLLGRELEAPHALTGPCPPPGATVPRLGAHELAAFARWLDAGAIYRAPAPRSAREVTP